MKELLFKASELGVMIRFTPISEQNYDNWVGRQGKTATSSPSWDVRSRHAISPK